MILTFAVYILILVNFKLTAFPDISNYVYDLIGLKNDETIEMTKLNVVYRFNLSLFFEVCFEAIPELIFTFIYASITNNLTDGFFLFSAIGSILAILHNLYPTIFMTIEKKSLKKALQTDRLGIFASESGEAILTLKTPVSIVGTAKSKITLNRRTKKYDAGTDSIPIGNLIPL